MKNVRERVDEDLGINSFTEFHINIGVIGKGYIRLERENRKGGENKG